jgi:PAS domain S-box-containing protein
MGPSNAWLERAVDHLDIALLLIAPERRVSYANAAAHRLFGLKNSALEGASLERLSVPERRGELRNIDEVLAGGGARKVRSAVRREDGTRVDVTMIIEPCFDEEGRVVAASIRYDAVAHLGRPSLMPRRQPTTAPPVPEGHVLQAALEPGPGARVERERHVHDGAPSFRDGRGSTPRPSWPSSQPTLDAKNLAARIQRVLRDQRWLEERLNVPPSVAPLDDARERARAQLVVGESLRVLQDLLDELSEHGSRDKPLT